jgi:hypothetical protein
VHPTFEQFVAALQDASQRAAIGLTISDADAAALLTRQDWALDYYHQWLSLFPATASPAPAAEATPAASPTPGAAATPGAEATFGAAGFGPPPQPMSFTSQMNATTLGSPSRMSSGLKRLLIIGGSVLAAVVLVVVGVGVYSGVVANSVSHHSATGSSSAPLPNDLHGLSAREYPLMEAVFESEGRTIPGMIASGMTTDRLRSLTDTIVTQADRACSAATSMQGGLDNPAYRQSFIAGYMSTAKVTADKAGMVYDAIEQYCAAG